MLLLISLLPLTWAQTPSPAKPGTIDADGNLIWRNGQGRYALQRQGTWQVSPLSTPGTNNDRVPSANAVEKAAMTKTLDALSALFQATPESHNMVGYWMNEARHYYSFARNTVPPGIAIERYPLYYHAAFFPFYLEEVLRNGKYVLQGPGETESISFQFNTLPGNLGRPVILKETLPNEHVQEIYLRPRTASPYHGFPVYEGQDMVLARPGKDLWSPVPLGRALRLALPLLEKDAATAQQRLDTLKKKNEETQSPAYAEQMRAHLEKYSGQFRTADPKKWQLREAGMLRELEYNRDKAAKEANPQRDADGLWYWTPLDALEQAKQAAAAVTPETAKQPACFLPVPKGRDQGRYSLRGDILPHGADAACEPLVTGNSSYFDLTRPRSEPQLLIVHSIGRCGKVENGQLTPRWKPKPGEVAHGCARHPTFWEQLDWSAVGALVGARPQ